MHQSDRPLVLSFSSSDTIPPLAWCVDTLASQPNATVWHGAAVETAPGAFVEGAWDAPFSEMAMDQDVCMGSGGRIRGDELVLVTPSHTLDALYSVRLADRMLVSNSLAFLLVRAGLELDPHYRRYLLDMRTIAKGLQKCVHEFPTRQQIDVQRHFFCNLVLNRKLELRREAKPAPSRFRDFQQYRDHLRDCLERITVNASDSRRAIRYPLIASLSRGYDSTASAVLAKECGCKEAITIVNASFGPATDDGSEIGELLSFDVVRRRAQDFRARPGLLEAEFVAMGDAGDVIFSNFEDVLPARTLITGRYGDSVWNPHTRHVGPEIRRTGGGGSSLAEFRLRVGFIHVPLPFIACQNHPDIRAIGRSEDLDPWRIGGSYDRPIARRIAEEAGIPREMFGQKKAYAALWWTREPPSPESHESYESFRRENRTYRDTIADLIHAPLYRFSRLWFRSTGLVSRVLRRLRMDLRIPQIVPRRFTPPPGEAQLVQWGMSIVCRRYELEGIQVAVPQADGDEPADVPA